MAEIDPRVLAQMSSRRKFIGGSAAAAAAMILGFDTATEVALPVSTADLALDGVEDPRIATALRFIRQNATQDIDVMRVAREAAPSTTMLPRLKWIVVPWPFFVR